MKLFACDLDGTLFNYFHTTDFIILHAIRKVLKRGNFFTIATGRNMHEEQMQDKFKDLPIYCLCMNGARVLDSKFNVVYEKWIDKAFIQEIMETFPTLNLEFNSRTCTYIRCSEEEFLKNHAKVSYFRKKSHDSFFKQYRFSASEETILKDDIFKINCGLTDLSLKEEFEAFIASHASSVINAPYAIGYYELTDASVNKGRSLQILAQSLSLTNDDVNVYGDGYNDIVMLRTFQHAFVPENGCDQAKEHAEKIIGKNTHYSVSRHMLKHSK